MIGCKELIDRALSARERAYVPYSKFAVGAALLCEDGAVFEGANIENAAYPATNCAERTAFFRAVMEGHREFKAIAVVGGPEGQAPGAFCPPCGVCRQVMREFCGEGFEIVLFDGKDTKTYTLAQLLPCSFGPENL